MLLLALSGSVALSVAQPPAKQPKPRQHAHKGDPSQNIDKRMAHMTQRYGLNETQQKQVRELMQSAGAKMKAVREKYPNDRKAAAPEMKQIRQEYHAQLKSILTPEQYDKWKADAKARHEKMKQRRAEKKDNKAPAPSPVKPDEDDDELNLLDE